MTTKPLADALEQRLRAELEGKERLPPDHLLVVAHGTDLSEMPLPLVSVGSAPLPLPVSAGDAAQWVEANAAELAGELAEQIDRAAAVLVAPELRKAVLQRTDRLVLWPLPGSPRFAMLHALLRPRPWWPGDAAPADVARWLQKPLNEQKPLKPNEPPAGDGVMGYVERGGLVLDSGWIDADGTEVLLPGSGAALLFLAERDVEKDRRKPAMRVDTGNVHRQFVEGLVNTGAAQRASPDGREVAIKDGRAELLVDARTELRLPGKSVQLTLDGIALNEALVGALRGVLGPKGLQHWAGFQAQLSEQGGTGRLVWSLDRHLEVMGYRKPKPATRKDAAAEAELFTAMELAVYDKNGVERQRAPLFHKVGSVDRLEDGDWVTARIELRINEAVYGGVRDFKTGKLGANWYPVPPALERLNHRRFPAALGLGHILAFRFRFAWGEDGRTWIKLSGRNALRLGGIKHRKRDDRPWRQLQRSLDELVRIDQLERWGWSREPETLDGMIELHAARWLVERTVLEVPVVEPMALPQLKTGDDLKMWRKGMGLTQVQTAERMGVSKDTVKRAERGRDKRLPRSIEKALRAKG